MRLHAHRAQLAACRVKRLRCADAKSRYNFFKTTRPSCHRTSGVPCIFASSRARLTAFGMARLTAAKNRSFSRDVRGFITARVVLPAPFGPAMTTQRGDLGLPSLTRQSYQARQSCPRAKDANG